LANRITTPHLDLGGLGFVASCAGLDVSQLPVIAGLDVPQLPVIERLIKKHEVGILKGLQELGPEDDVEHNPSCILSHKKQLSMRLQQQQHSRRLVSTGCSC
jgi:hypothetical protein